MAVEIRNITKTFQEICALQEITFDVEEGSLFGLIGPDGSGKSTLFRIIASLIRPDSGDCRVFGYDINRDYRRIRELIGYMPGRFSLYYDLTVDENLAFYATVFGTSVDKNHDLIATVYSQIEPFRKRLAGKLSGGMKQKLALSCALIHRPRLLILDEPTTGVDAVSRQEFWDLLKMIQQEGITIIVSTPYMDEASLCDRIALIQKGRILSVAEPDYLQKTSGLILFALKSASGAYNYLERIRDLKMCKSAWLFGDELHIVLESEKVVRPFRKTLADWKDPGIILERVRPGIEDIFIDLMRT
jgi:ABC-type multidrug transport system ATPase subunit